MFGDSNNGFNTGLQKTLTLQQPVCRSAHHYFGGDGMRLKMLQKKYFLFTVIAALMLITGGVSAQNDTTPKKRLRSPAAVKGFIGGESHDGYVIRARKGQTMIVQISWRREGDNHAEFMVSQSPDFSNAGQVVFGKVSGDGKRWTGKFPKTQDYYLYVGAHPTAHYTLKVTNK